MGGFEVQDQHTTQHGNSWRKLNVNSTKIMTPTPQYGIDYDKKNEELNPNRY
jgi:hypothetical protein